MTELSEYHIARIQFGGKQDKYGRRPCICADCSHLQYEPLKMASRHCKTRCRKCGSTFLEFVPTAMMRGLEAKA